MAYIDSRHYNDDPALANETREGYVSLPVGILFPPITVFIVGIVLALLLTRVDVDATAAQATSANQKNTGHHIAPLFTAEVQHWGEKIASWSEDWNLDPNLVATVMQIESCGNPKAVSRAGAMGLFQVMPYHFETGEAPYQPATNAGRGLAYLRRSLDARGGNVRLGLAGYNGGINGTKKAESTWPAETIRYVYWGTGIYADAQKGKTSSERLNEWLGSGGASLCAQAARQLELQ